MKIEKVLVLNADFIPLNLVPLSTVSWQDAMVLLYQDKATAIEYQDAVVHTINDEFKVPSVIVLRRYAYFKKFAKLNKYNIKLRDGFKCQYCNRTFNHKSLTIDHFLPKSKGGKGTWTNLVAACKPCNYSKKNDHKITPKHKPKRPTYFQLAKKLLAHEMITNEHFKQYIRIG